MNAAKKSILLLLWLVVTSFTTASALTPSAAETRVGQKSFAPLETRQAEPLQPPGLHQRNASCGYELAPESLLAARTAVPNGSVYSVAFETRLNPASYPGVSRAGHFQEANGALLRAIEGDAQFGQIMQQGGVNLQRTATGLAPRTPPAGWTWHHAPESGVMQLVPRTQHAPGSIFQNTLHPGGQGGYSIWGQ